jgi:predicted AAA+ superfamily ATPase
MYKRKIYEDLKTSLDRPEVTVLTGMRRSGKTTLLEALYKELDGRQTNKYLFDLENATEQDVFDEKDFNDILNNLNAIKPLKNSKRTVVLLDEIQAFTQIVPAIKYLYDHHNIKFVVTGSSSFYLKNLFSESLSGRKFIFELYPLDFEEFLWFKQEDTSGVSEASFAAKAAGKNRIRTQNRENYYEEYLQFGGFPQVVLEENLEIKKKILADIFNAYFEKDVRHLSDFADYSMLRRLILLLMRRVGNRVDVSRLASEVGVSRPTLYNYLSFLEATYFLQLVSVHSKSIDKEVSSSQKLYICDNGLITTLGLANDGELFENAVYLNLRERGKVTYNLNSRGREIDFIIDSKMAIEVKTTATEADINKLQRQSAALSIDEFYVLTKNFVDSKGVIVGSDL